MTISCVCLTHGRQWVLEEAVQSYLNQTLQEDTELLILNDCPEQPLTCQAPGVRVVNIGYPISNLMAKSVTAIMLAKGPFIAWWDDDDISLPNRLALSMAKIGDAVAYRTAQAWLIDGPEFRICHNFNFGSSLFRKEWILPDLRNDWDKANDVALDARLMNAGQCLVEDKDLPLSETFFVYRWGGIHVHHDSGLGYHATTPEERHTAFRRSTLANPRFRPGPYELKPHWNEDYVAKVSRFIRFSRGDKV